MSNWHDSKSLIQGIKAEELSLEALDSVAGGRALDGDALELYNSFKSRYRNLYMRELEAEGMKYNNDLFETGIQVYQDVFERAYDGGFENVKYYHDILVDKIIERYGDF